MVVVILAVEDQRLQRSLGITRRGRNIRNDVFQYRVDVDPRLRADFWCVLRRDPDDLLDFVLDPLRIRCRKVDFIHNREDFQVVVQSQIGIRERLCFHTL